MLTLDRRSYVAWKVVRRVGTILNVYEAATYFPWITFCVPLGHLMARLSSRCEEMQSDDPNVIQAGAIATLSGILGALINGALPFGMLVLNHPSLYEYQDPVLRVSCWA